MNKNQSTTIPPGLEQPARIIRLIAGIVISTTMSDEDFSLYMQKIEKGNEPVKHWPCPEEFLSKRIDVNKKLKTNIEKES
jgi:hypothetical protein